ncbi:SDR family NAD(P)-dependent oxidoreductase [Streptomyces sp. NPDC005811]|uniref:SDR family NAD(P)-dependent oxidoreductase n=1 Tax=Streptomyces sp. NPDC005811 TaxID=3154565 RepID=UPI0033F9523B
MVTGGASGIGHALAHAYGRRGAAVLIADRDEQAPRTARAGLTDADIEAHRHLVDLRDPAAVGALVERTVSIAPIGALCLDAGVSGGGRGGRCRASPTTSAWTSTRGPCSTR